MRSLLRVDHARLHGHEATRRERGGYPIPAEAVEFVEFWRCLVAAIVASRAELAVDIAAGDLVGAGNGDGCWRIWRRLCRGARGDGKRRGRQQDIWMLH